MTHLDSLEEGMQMMLLLSFDLSHFTSPACRRRRAGLSLVLCINLGINLGLNFVGGCVTFFAAQDPGSLSRLYHFGCGHCVIENPFPFFGLCKSASDFVTPIFSIPIPIVIYFPAPDRYVAGNCTFVFRFRASLICPPTVGAFIVVTQRFSVCCHIFILLLIFLPVFDPLSPFPSFFFLTALLPFISGFDLYLHLPPLAWLPPLDPAFPEAAFFGALFLHTLVCSFTASRLVSAVCYLLSS
jgi:hypothetical protein